MLEPFLHKLASFIHSADTILLLECHVITLPRKSEFELMAAHCLTETAVVVVNHLVGGGAPLDTDFLRVQVLFQLNKHLEGVGERARSHLQHLLLLAQRQL